jgi:hypothetical protein
MARRRGEGERYRETLPEMGGEGASVCVSHTHVEPPKSGWWVMGQQSPLRSTPYSLLCTPYTNVPKVSKRRCGAELLWLEFPELATLM